MLSILYAQFFYLSMKSKKKNCSIFTSVEVKVLTENFTEVKVFCEKFTWVKDK